MMIYLQCLFYKIESFQDDERSKGSLGFGGSIPCAQTKGERKFYTFGQHPEELLTQGDYRKLPIFFGANSHEGLFVHGGIGKWCFRY